MDIISSFHLAPMAAYLISAMILLRQPARYAVPRTLRAIAAGARLTDAGAARLVRWILAGAAVLLLWPVPMAVLHEEQGRFAGAEILIYRALWPGLMVLFALVIPAAILLFGLLGDLAWGRPRGPGPQARRF